MKVSTFERARVLIKQISELNDIITEIKSDEIVKIIGQYGICNTVIFKDELLELLEKTKAKLEAEMEAL